MSVLRQNNFTAANGFAFRVTVESNDGIINPASIQSPHRGGVVVGFWDIATDICAAKYYLLSLLERNKTYDDGFMLHAGTPEWTIDPETMRSVDEFLKESKP